MELPKRKSTRLKNYDYSQSGYYFITVCSYKHKKIFSNIVGQGLAPAENEQKSPNIKTNTNATVGQGLAPAENQLSPMGEIVEQELLNLEKRYENIEIDKYVIMPNHIHAIIIIRQKAAGASPCPTLSDVVCAFKSIATHKCRMIRPNEKIWQTSFHDHIIRGETDYLKIWNYIDANPLKWKEDCFYNAD